MQVRLLGAHNLETRTTRHTCFLIDGVLTVDAGSLASTLTREELFALKAILLTHHHFDHVRDIPTLGLIRLNAEEALPVYGLQETLDVLVAHIINDEVYPNLSKPLDEELPSLALRPLLPGRRHQVNGYTVTLVPATHPVPAVGYVVESPTGQQYGFSGDTGRGLSPFFEWRQPLDALFVDMTYPSRMERIAAITGHMTPERLRQEITAAQERGLRMPRIVAAHRGLGTDAEIVPELGRVQRETGAAIEVGQEGMLF